MATAHAPPRPGATPSSPWPVFWVACIATFLVSLDTTMLFAAFDPLRHAFSDASAADLSWVLNAYTVVYATMLIPAGGLADTHGRKRVFLIGVALFLAASAACGLAGSVGWLIAARVLQAVGAFQRHALGLAHEQRGRGGPVAHPVQGHTEQKVRLRPLG